MRKISDINRQVLPTCNVRCDEFDGTDTFVGITLDDYAAFWSYFAGMSSLCIAGKHDPWIFLHDFAVMHMSESPIVVALGGKSVGRGGCIGFMSFASG